MPACNWCWSRKGSDRPIWSNASAGSCRRSLRSSAGWKQHRDQSALHRRQRRQRLYAQDAARAARRFRGACGGGRPERVRDGDYRAAGHQMDLEMPIVDGWEATRRLKGNPQTRDIPVIALSAHALAGEREKALAAGCNEFDTKPIEFDRLVATMRRILGLKCSQTVPLKS